MGDLPPLLSEAKRLTQALDIALENRISRIPDALLEVERFLEKQGIDASAQFDFAISIEEVLTNIVSYAYKDSARHEISVSLTVEPSAVICVLIDDGVPFNPLDIPPPDLDAALEDREVGGLGIHFVRNMMQDVVYKRRDDRNILRLSRKVDP
jgi:serine/threonine-protein kinase RsbW